MKNDDILTELLAMRARLDEMISAIRSAPTPANDVKPEPTYMKMQEFAARWQTSRSTLYKLIGEGLPIIGTGHDRRIKVADGDAWMVKHTKSRKAS